MKRLFFFITIYVFLGANFVSAQVASPEAASDIRHRTFVYFYPNSKIPSETELAKYLDDFTRVNKLPETTGKAVASLSVVNDFDESYAVPDQNLISYFGRGISKTQAVEIQNSKDVLVVDIAYPQTMFLTAYKPVMAFLHEVATTHKGLIWDSETRELFEPDAWKEKRLASWKGGFPNIVDHITIHAYNTEGDGIRAITLGMAKFGLPDVVVNNFSWSLNNPMGNLINLTSQSLLEGATPSEKPTLKLNIGTLKNTTFKQNLISDLKENAVSELEIEFGEGKWEDGDPYNTIIEILFDTAEGKTLGEKQDSTVSTLFGWEDSVTLVKHNSEILAASARAKAKLNQLREDFNAGLEPGEYILLKAPFKTTEDGNEWMWVEVMSWKKTAVKGLLKNEPYHVPGLRAGSIVEINQDDVFDYIRNFANGTSEGNETGKIMSKSQR